MPSFAYPLTIFRSDSMKTRVLNLFILLLTLCFPPEAFGQRNPSTCAPCIERAEGDSCVSTGKEYCADVCYDPNEWSCLICNGNANLYRGAPPVCCGTFACSASQQCCVDKCYNPSVQVCCSYGSESSVCNQGVFGVTCCGPVCDYNNNAETLCCGDAPDGRPYLASGGRSCCHGVGVDLTSERCCVDRNGRGSTVPRNQSCPNF